MHHNFNQCKIHIIIISCDWYIVIIREKNNRIIRNINYILDLNIQKFYKFWSIQKIRFLTQKNNFLQMKMKKRNVNFLKLGFKICLQIKEWKFLKYKNSKNTLDSYTRIKGCTNNNVK